MALLIDGDISTQSDLTALDTSLLEVCRVEQIDLTAKLAVAQSEICNALTQFLTEAEQTYSTRNVVISDSIRRWHQLKVLELIYRDAYFSQTNDRYEKRWNLWSVAVSRAEKEALEYGVPVQLEPLHRPEEPLLTLQDGDSLPTTYFIRVTWVRADGAESAPSSLCSIFAEAPHRLEIRMRRAQCDNLLWHVYAGNTADAQTRQTDSPLPQDGVWASPAGALGIGEAAGQGQQPSTIVRRTRGILRG
jgi:hypothetical protein